MVQVVQVRMPISTIESCSNIFFFFKTTIIPREEDIDADVFAAMTSLGCFKDRQRLIEALLNSK